MLKSTNKKYIKSHKNIYRHTEKGFEKLTSLATAILGNSITFIIALGLVIFWFANEQFYTQDIHSIIGDVILGITFLNLFIIQKSFNRFSGSLHLKVNELVASHEPASNAVMNAEEKTEDEITELSKEYSELAEKTKEEGKKILNRFSKKKVGEQ
ncbi:MAG: low affinity iron permease family protein [Bacteroidetes bacterium]|nr:low affinity iron permease family protein [Bacteroidota bacterium]